MIGICRLFLALVAAALVACPVMALDVQNRGDGIEAMLVSKSVQAAPGIEDVHRDASGPDSMEESCPERNDCSIIAINQASPAPTVSPLPDEANLIAIPAVQFSVEEVLIKGFSTGPPAGTYKPRPQTPLVLKQRFLI